MLQEFLTLVLPGPYRFVFKQISEQINWTQIADMLYFEE